MEDVWRTRGGGIELRAPIAAPLQCDPAHLGIRLAALLKHYEAPSQERKMSRAMSIYERHDGAPA
jgi:hypothetical protein